MNQNFNIYGLAVAAMLLPQAATAQQIEAPEGHIVIGRDVGPRNALHPGGNAPISIDVGRQQNIFEALEGVRALSDAEAANIAGAIPDGARIAAPVADATRFTDQSALLRGDGTGTSSGGLVTGTVDSAMSAMRGALRNLPGRGE